MAAASVQEIKPEVSSDKTEKGGLDYKNGKWLILHPKVKKLKIG